MKRTALLLIVLTIIAKFIGFGREITLAYFYGTSSTSDAYLIALIIPTVIFAFIGSAISTSYIPIYNKIQKSQDTSKANWFTNNLINIVITLCSILITIVLIFPEPIVRVFASGFDESTLKLAVSFTRISIFGIYFIGLGYVMKSLLQIKGNFTIPALTGLPMNIVIIMSIYFSSVGNIMYLALGLVVGMFAHFIFMVPSVYKIGFKYKPVIDINDPQIKEMVFITIPVLLGVAVNDINKIIDKTIASQVTTGAISALTYANTFNNVIQAIFVLSISTAMYPLISKMSVEGNAKGLKKSVSEAISLINLLVIPVTIGTMIFAEPIIRLLYGRGSFGEDSILMTSGALFFYSIGMLGIGMREVLSRPFYAMQDTKTPMINATIGVVLNIILNIILSRYLGIGGIALATSISAFATTGLMFISLKKKIGSFENKQIISPLVKIIIASLVMGLLAKLTFNYLAANIGQNLSVTISIVIGALAYFLLIYLMGVQDIIVIVNVIKKKISKNNLSDKL
ncbi:murein biosynthesis integral membrane protein MurJ [Sporosarcina sp. CAU 1771]